jgi:glucose 1-dehydrogenase
MQNNSFDLTGKTILITGSSRGIGKALALKLAEYGADIIIHCANAKEKANEVAQGIRTLGRSAFVVSADLASNTGAREIFEEVKKTGRKVDILILNASIQIVKEWETVTREDFDKQIAVNLRSSLELIQLFVPRMVEQGWGRIITVGSAQQAKPHPRMIVYSATKTALETMVRTLAKQLGKDHITVNNIAPGAIFTDRNVAALSDQEYLKQVISNIPVGYIGEAEDCAGAALLLCSEAGRYINGINLYVDGGTHLG